MTPALLRVDCVTKRFRGVAALDSVSLEATPGSVHAILGENGAGKTTLLNLLFGLLRPDSGRLLWNGEEAHLHSPADSIRLGIGMVHQHFMLVPALTVWENVLLTHPDRDRFLVRRESARRWVSTVSARLGLALDPDARVESLPVGARQRVEIAKALARDASLLILDEPTAVLTPGETKDLLRLVTELRRHGTAILFVSHKIPEVLEVASRVTVLRRGRVVGTFEGELSSSALAACVLGTDAPTTRVETRHRTPNEEVKLALRGLGARFESGACIDDVTLDVRAGEIVGVAGVDGNGQEELAALIAGIASPESGSIFLAGEDVTRDDPRTRWSKGLGVLPGDRAREGLVLDFALWENLALRTFGTGTARRLGGMLVEPSVHRREAERLVESYDVRGPGIGAPARFLSGGNQQKLLLARELDRGPKVLVALHPTRGLDVGAAADVLRRIAALRDAGSAVLLVSTELDDVIELADRVGVLARGRWREIATRDRDELGAAMLAGG